ncbi:hypothetical protein QUH73_13490 [Labilibaculum sp. K2S]|uniref:hypothetical protein n=1 Tax=Labilibaculum sp. K2S TaxID=3056386 RepID=UPI0025A411AB|nr:hypothetical protein [Labilibaculum sp. K2S]MDM8160831.1 hypothetical protein [Labilibaculum sp. K2S]
MTTTSNTNDINDYYDLIDSLKSLIENNKQSSGGHISETSDGRGHMTPIRTGIDNIAVSELLNEVLIGGQIKKIAHSENKKLISSFYQTLQDLYIELEKLSFGFTPEIKVLLEQIRSSFAHALPNEDLTKKEIEDNIKIIHNREQDNRDKNILNEENRKIKEIITGNITKISILLLGVALCYLWGKTMLLIYVLIICIGLLVGIISQLRNKPKRPNAKKTKSSENTPPKTRIQKTKENNHRQKADSKKNGVRTENKNSRFLPNEIINIAFKIGEQTYSNFLTSFKSNKNDYGLVSKLEVDLYSFFICDMLSYSIHKNEKLRAVVLNTFLRRISDKYSVLLNGNSSVIKVRLEDYFKTYKMIRNQSIVNNGFKSLEEQLLYVLQNTEQETQIQERYAPIPQNAFEKMNNTKMFMMHHNEYFNRLFEELERKVSNYAP